MPTMNQLYLLQITAFALAQAGAAILGVMLFENGSVKNLMAGVSCALLAAAIFYTTAPR